MKLRTKFLGHSHSISLKNQMIIRLLDILCFGDSDYLSSFEMTGYWWLLIYNNQAVGYCNLKKMNSSVGFLSRSGVLPNYRGKGLQKKLIKIRERYARKLGLTEIKTYVSNVNKPSINNLLKLNYQEYKPRKIWGLSLEESTYFRKTL